MRKTEIRTKVGLELDVKSGRGKETKLLTLLYGHLIDLIFIISKSLGEGIPLSYLQ